MDINLFRDNAIEHEKTERFNYTVGAVVGIVGALLLLVGTFLHPSEANPNLPFEAFKEYAESTNWVGSHLLQLAGVALMMVQVRCLSQIFTNNIARVWAQIGLMGATASLALAAALQAVDGVALKRVVDSWVVAAEPEREALFQAAFAVRQIEIGLASMFALMGAVTVILYGLALLSDRTFWPWLGWLALVAGLATGVTGILIAYTGFSELEMMISMPANLLLLAWVVAVSVWMWRKVVKLE